MYLSNSVFVQSIVDTGVNISDMESGLHVCLKLLKKYGSKLKLSAFQEVIAGVDAGLASLLELLSQQDKLNIKDINELIVQLSRHTEGHIPSFEVVGTDSSDIDSSISAKFAGAEINKKPTDKIGLEVSGEGRYYKRSLEKDLDILLK